MKNTRKSKKKLYILIFSFVVALSLLVPGITMHFISDYRNIGVINDVPEDMYDMTASAVSKVMSEQLTESEKVSLILDSEGSTLLPVDDNPMKKNTYALKNGAIDAVNALYDKQLLSHALFDENSWYYWTIEYYKSVDNTTKTYYAYSYTVHFSDYSNTEHINVHLTENGTVLSITSDVNTHHVQAEEYQIAE